MTVKIKTIIVVLALMACILVTERASSQDYVPAWKISMAGGYMNYFGDLSPYTIKHWDDWGNWFKFFGYNKYYIPSVSFGISIERYLSPGITLRLQTSRGEIAMSDRYRKHDGDYDRKALHWDRALNFETKLQDAGLDVVFRSNNGRLLPVNFAVAPYFFIGGGVTHFLVKGDLYDGNGKPYDYANPNVRPDGLYETALRPLMTETSKPYPDVVPYINGGLGLSLNMGKRVSLSVETDIKYAFSDYLDDASGSYKEKYVSPEAAYAAHPGTNAVTPGRTNRGNHDGVNDFYIFNKLSLSINLGNKTHHYFHAPAIYLPGPASDRDTLAGAPVMSSPSLQPQTQFAQDSGVQNIKQDLEQIKSGLISLRFAHIDQNYIIRENETRNRLAVLQKERDRLSIRENKSGEDSLRMNLDNHLIDSLNNALAAIDEARLQLRSDMAYSPVVTEYMDSTKIMIYKGPQLRGDSARLPVIGSLGMDEADSLSHLRYDTAGIRIAEHQFYRMTATDSIRQELSVLQRQAAARHDSASMEQLTKLEARLDSIAPENGSLDTGLIPSEYAIRQDALRIRGLERQSDSLRRTLELQKQEQRNAFQRFFDQFKKHRRENDNSRFFPSNDASVASLYQDDSNEAAERLLQQNEDEIHRLQDQINGLPRYSTPVYSAPPTVIFQADRDRKSARQQRRDRRQNRDFNRDILAAMSSGNRGQPAVVSPNIILPPQYGYHEDNASQLQNIQLQLDTLKQQYDTAGASHDLWAEKILADTAPSNNQDEVIDTLRSMVDSLSGQLAIWKARDTLARANRDSIVLLHYPTVSMYFPVGATTLDQSEGQKIRPLAAVAKKYPLARVLVTGFTDGTGNRSVNEMISQKRCKAVKKILIDEYGVSAERLVTRTRISGSKEGSNPLMRRVDIQFLP